MSIVAYVSLKTSVKYTITVEDKKKLPFSDFNFTLRLRYGSVNFNIMLRYGTVT